MNSDSPEDKLRAAIRAALELMINPYDGAPFEDGEVPAVDILRAILRETTEAVGHV